MNNGKIFYGWYIVGIAFLANFMSVGTGFYVFNAFMEPLCELRNWTRTDINMALVLATFFGFIGQFIYGTLVIRVGARILMLIGSFVGGIAFILLIRAEQLWQFYLFYILLYMGNGAYGGIVASTAVNNWFQAKRGKALGIATSGISFSGAILPPLALLLILHRGIEDASLGIGLMILIVAPLAWLIVRDWPEQYGMLPDGASQDANIDHRQLNSSPQQLSRNIPIDYTVHNEIFWTLPRLLKTGAFWKLGIAYSLIMIGTVGVMSQLKPRFADIGFSDMAAMGMMAATAFMGAIGKYVWGMLCDRFEPRKIVTLLAAANSVGLGLALFRDSLPALYLFVLIFGFTMGGIMSTYPIIVADLFGRKAFASVLRFVSIFLVLQLMGYIIAGQSFDRLGSYDPAYILFIALDLIAASLLFFLKRPAESPVSQ
ncbi:MAG: MFS transporter [Deltaproteobacteria bacterium]|nr:MFS transporter [Deltaproteobacteria bacterium]